MTRTSAGTTGPTVRTGRPRATAAVLLVIVAAAGCSGAKAADLCSQFDSVGRQVLTYQDNFGSALFEDIDALGSLAAAEADEGVKADGRRLQKIARDRRTTVPALSSASLNIARQCDKISIETRVTFEQNLPGFGPPSTPGPSRPTTTFRR